MQRRDPVMVAWVLGLGLAVLAYAVGPQYFLFRVADTLHVAFWRLGEVVGDLSLVARDAVRASAIGLFATFVVLGVTVERRGGRAKGSLLSVTLLFIVLVGEVDAPTQSNMRWVLALIVSGLGALAMTRRLRQTAVAAY